MRLPAYCMDTDGGAEKQDDAAATSTNQDFVKTKKKLFLLVRINTPHNKRAIDTCRVYPYPVALTA